MKKKKIFSEKKLVKTILAGISLLIMYCSAWIAEPLFEKTVLPMGERASFLSNQVGDNLENAYRTAISESKQSIHFMIFSLTNDRIIQALRQKSEEGIAVKVICDAKASPHIVEKLGPKVHLVRRFAKGLMHLKVLVIDEKYCWIGSANMTDESLKMHGNLVVTLADAVLGKTLMQKALTLQEYHREGEVLPQDFMIGNQKISLSFLPDDKKGSLRIKELIRSAKKTIRIAMFTWTRFDLAKEVIAAKKRGVQVEVVLDNSSAKGASAKIAELLKKEKINLKYSQMGVALLHHKFLWVDDNILEIGSANWTKAAFTQNDDCFLILYDLTTEQQAQLHKLWKTILSDSLSK